MRIQDALSIHFIVIGIQILIHNFMFCGVVASKDDVSFNITRWGEKSLIKYILDDYDRRSRPVVDGKTPRIDVGDNITVNQISVEFGLGLIQILDLDEMEQVLTTSVRSLYRWKDYHLVWDPNQFDNITQVNIPTSKIWLPDIALYNYADERLEERRECDAKVSKDGLVEWHPMAIYKSTCPVKTKFFPFDKQACKLKFGPWTYDGFRVNVTLYDDRDNIDMHNYVKSPEWEILATKAKYNQYMYPCCPEPYPDISFYIWIQRQPAFYNYILILPCFLLSSLTLVLFWLPPETPAKMVLGMNIFVAFFLLLLLLEDSTPSASSSFPLIGTYYCLNMGLITLSTFLCLIVVNFHFRGDNRQEVPWWVKKLALQHGARLLFVTVNITQEKKQPEEVPLRATNKSTNSSGIPGFTGFGGVGMMDSCGGITSAHTDNNMLAINMPTGMFRGQHHMGMVDERISYTMGGQNLQHQSPYSMQQPHQLYQEQYQYPMQHVHQQQHHLETGIFPMEAAGSTYPGQHGVVHGSSNTLDNRKRQTMVVQDYDGPSRTTKPVNYNDVDDVITDCFRPRKRQSGQNTSQSGGPFRFEVDGDPTDPNTTRRVNMVTKDVNDIVKGLRYLQKKNESKERVNKIVAEWRAVGMVLDRLFFVFYVFIIILSIVLFFPKSGNEVTPNDTGSVN